MHYVLIVNPSGRLSAAPTIKDFNRGNYETSGMLVYPLTMDAPTRTRLWENRDNAYILPVAKTIPVDAVVFTVIEPDTSSAFLYAGEEPVVRETYESLTAEACISPFCKAVTGEQGEAIQPV